MYGVGLCFYSASGRLSTSSVKIPVVLGYNYFRSLDWRQGMVSSFWDVESWTYRSLESGKWLWKFVRYIEGNEQMLALVFLYDCDANRVGGRVSCRYLGCSAGCESNEPFCCTSSGETFSMIRASFNEL